MRSLLVLIALVCGCGAAGPAGGLRFHNQAPVWRVNDRADVPKKPADRPFVRALYHTDQPFFRRVTRWMDVPAPRRAINVNALDEVPDSTWFTNRIGVRDLSAAEVARGPNSSDGPDTSAPWKVVSSKVGGQSVGFIIEDALGARFLLKFDEPDFPVMETATDVVVQRLLWAVGYHVPEDSIVYFDRSQLVLDQGATVKDVFGNKRPMTIADLDGSLAKVRSEGTRFRGLTSKFLPGIPIGGFPQRGVRADDPNDRIPHEHRRELRGLRVFYAWLQYTDAKENNTLDVYEEDPADPSRHYVVHYLVDFGKSLGANSTMARYYADGHQYMLDLVDVPLQLLTLGLYPRSWEGTRAPNLEGIPQFDSAHFEPGEFVPHDPYEPFDWADEADNFWAAKILIQLRPEHIRAAVEQAEYPDPRATEYMTRVLIERQRKAARYYFERTAPLDRFEVRGRGATFALCFEDLALAYRLGAEPAATSYAAASYDGAGTLLAWRGSANGAADGRTCLPGIAPGGGADAYTIVRLALTRGKSFPPVTIHLARDPATGTMRVIGLRRY